MSVPGDWHRDFFEGLWPEVQRRSFDAQQTRELVDAVLEALQPVPGAKLLDVPCGSGRIALELAARGYRVTGVERSRTLLDEARAEATRRDLDVEWIEGDMWSLDAGSGFDHALCMWSSIGYGSEEDDDRFFASLAACLVPEGSLLIETHVVETLLHWFEPQGFRWAGEIGVSESRHFDPESGRIETEWLLSGPEAREHKTSSLRLYTYRELTTMLARHGFGEFEAFGSPDLEPFELGSSRLLLVSRRSTTHATDDGPERS